MVRDHLPIIEKVINEIKVTPIFSDIGVNQLLFERKFFQLTKGKLIRGKIRGNKETFYTHIDFEDEKDLLMFLLKW